MKLGVPMEPAGETRVAIAPSSMKKLLKAGFEVLIEKDAGKSSNNLDSDYESAGAKIATRAEVLSCETIISIRFPGIEGISKGSRVACVADPFRNPEHVKSCIDAGITLLSMDIPTTFAKIIERNQPCY